MTENTEPCAGCAEEDVNPPDPLANIELPPNAIDPSKLRPKGVHLKGVGSFIMGEGACRSIDVAQNQQGLLLVRVQFTGNRRTRVFEITPMDMIMEFEEKPVNIEIARSI